MPEITKHVFDDWWTGMYIDRLTPLLPQEVEALVDHHWRELQATAIRHSLREMKEETKEDYNPTEGCTCGATIGNLHHLRDCPVVYQEAQE